jgi:hypothetical protein
MSYIKNHLMHNRMVQGSVALQSATWIFQRVCSPIYCENIDCILK